MGHAIKLSDEVRDVLQELRKEREGYDACLRRILGLPSRKGIPQPLREYHLVTDEDGTPLTAKVSQADARGEAILLSVKRGLKASHRKKHLPVLKVREVPE